MSNERLPIFEAGLRVTLVESVITPGKLAVMVRGARFCCPLPDGYDGYTRVNVDDRGWVLVSHPRLPSLLADGHTGEVHPIDQPIRERDLTSPKIILPVNGSVN